MTLYICVLPHLANKERKDEIIIIIIIIIVVVLLLLCGRKLYC